MNFAHAMALVFLLSPAPDPDEVSLSDLQRFPSREYVAAWCRTSCATSECLDAAWKNEFWAHRRWEIYNAAGRNSHLWDPWQQLVLAQEENNDPVYRLEALRNLRLHIGPAAYAAGQMPPPVPAAEQFWPTKAAW